MKYMPSNLDFFLLILFLARLTLTISQFNLMAKEPKLYLEYILTTFWQKSWFSLGSIYCIFASVEFLKQL